MDVFCEGNGKRKTRCDMTNYTTRETETSVCVGNPHTILASPGKNKNIECCGCGATAVEWKEGGDVAGVGVTEMLGFVGRMGWG